MHGKKLYVSNVGDSEAVLGRRNSTGSAFEPVLLTEKHLPTVQSEKSRIEGACPMPLTHKRCEPAQCLR